jgi:predicted XRE-type DNA-binding protein
LNKSTDARRPHDHPPQRQRLRGRRCARCRHPAVKAQLVSRIDAIIGDRGLSQREAGRILDIAQPDLSNLLRGRFRGYSVERLMRMTAFNCDVSILVAEKGREAATIPCARRSPPASGDVLDCKT